MTAEPQHSRVDWSDLLALAVAKLRLAPAAFWTMSPREFAAAKQGLAAAQGGAPPRVAPMTRRALAALEVTEAARQDAHAKE